MQPNDANKTIFNQTMIRIKDPKKSLAFYTDILGMTLIDQKDFESGKFSLFFLTTLHDHETIPSGAEEKASWLSRARTVLELTHNWGTESDPDFSYHNGNAEPRGFGHLGFSVPNVETACERYEELGVEFIKNPAMVP